MRLASAHLRRNQLIRVRILGGEVDEDFDASRISLRARKMTSFQVLFVLNVAISFSLALVLNVALYKITKKNWLAFVIVLLLTVPAIYGILNFVIYPLYTSTGAGMIAGALLLLVITGGCFVAGNVSASLHRFFRNK